MSTLGLLALLQSRWVWFLTRIKVLFLEKTQIKKRKKEGEKKGGKQSEWRWWQRVAWNPVSVLDRGAEPKGSSSIKKLILCHCVVHMSRTSLWWRGTTSNYTTGELRPSVTDTQSSSGIKPVHTWDRLCGHGRFCARSGRMFDSQRDFWLPSDNLELLWDGLRLFSWRSAPGDPQLINQSLGGNMQMSLGLIDFYLLAVLCGGFWSMKNKKKKEKKTDHWG